MKITIIFTTFVLGFLTSFPAAAGFLDCSTEITKQIKVIRTAEKSLKKQSTKTPEDWAEINRLESQRFDLTDLLVDLVTFQNSVYRGQVSDSELADFFKKNPRYNQYGCNN